jgi:putative membrane protein
MHRRNLIALVAAAPVAGFALQAFAQSAAPMGDAEMTHAEQTGMVGALSLLQSKLALENAADEKVKMFAEFEVAEQETIGDILKSMKDDAADAAQGALQPPTDEEATAMLDDAGKAKLEELTALTGKEFDQAYVAANLEGHQKLLAIQEDYLKTGTNREHLSVAKLARGMITEHIAHLEELQSMVG